MGDRFPHLSAVLQALLVTFLWSTSWVLIRIGLRDIPAVTFAGLRYALAFLCLLPVVSRPAVLRSLRGLTARKWGQLVLLGLLFYAVTQGAQYVGLAYLPFVTVGLLFNFTTVIVALLGIVLLAERPTRLQWLGVFVNFIGMFVYFYPWSVSGGQAWALIVVIVGVLANAESSILGRDINRQRDIDPSAVTLVSMGVGAVLLLTGGVSFEGLPPLSLTNWAIIGWLAVVNTAFAFTLWNYTLRTLSAMESSIINSTMLLQVAVLGWVFMGEYLTSQQGVGMVLAGLGGLIVQLRRR